jgi:hypothetical protein
MRKRGATVEATITFKSFTELESDIIKIKNDINNIVNVSETFCNQFHIWIDDLEDLIFELGDKKGCQIDLYKHEMELASSAIKIFCEYTHNCAHRITTIYNNIEQCMEPKKDCDNHS